MIDPTTLLAELAAIQRDVRTLHGSATLTSLALRPCPFCGGAAEVEREGTPRQSAIVGCTECHARLESNENGAGYMWNTRSGGMAITPDARDALNRYAEHATAAIGATWSERDQLRNREERRSYACAFLAALIRDNPDLLPEYTAAVLADEIKRGVRR